MAWFITGLRHETIRLAKKYRRLQKHELLILNNRLSQNTEDEPTEVLDTLADTSDAIIEAENSIFFQEALSLLTLQQRKVITAVILEEKTEKEIAAKFGISQPAVHHMKERALNKLKKHFISDELTAN